MSGTSRLERIVFVPRTRITLRALWTSLRSIDAHSARWLDEARRYSVPELAGETLVADRLTEEDTVALERIVKRRRDIASDEHAEPLSGDEKGELEASLGKAAGDENLFERKRKEAAVKAKLDELKDVRKVATLPRQPLLAERGSVQLPRFAAYNWLLGDGWTLMEIGVLVATLACFQNDDPSIFVDGRFEGEGDHRALVVPGGIGADLRMRGKIAGSAVENGGSGFVRVKAALTVLQRNKWLEVEQTVGELRIRLGERARRFQE